jgi:recombination protein RecT
MSSTAVTEKPKEKRPSVRSVVDGIQPEVMRMLPAQISPDQFARATETALVKDSSLLDCNRKSLFEAVMQCAETGLMPNGRDAALVRYKGAVQFIPMIAGILKLMRNTGEIATIGAEVFCERDEFDYGLGSDPFVRHRPALDDRGEVQGAYAIVKTKDGAQYIEIMGRNDIDKVMRMSKAQNGPWKSWFEEMARKTVLRRLAKKCPLSTDRLIDLTSRDDHMYDLNTVKSQPSTSQIVSAKLRGEPLPIEDQSQDTEETPPETHEDDSGESETGEDKRAAENDENDSDGAPVADMGEERG